MCAEPARRCGADLPVCRAGAGLEHRRRLCRADLVRPCGVLRHRRLYVDDPVRAASGAYALDRALGRRAHLRGRRRGSRDDLRAAQGPFFILSTLAAAEVVRISALNWSSLTGGPEGLSILPVAEPRQHGVRVEDHLRGLMLGYLVLLLCASPSALECSRYGYYLLRRARRRGRCARRRHQSVAGADGRDGAERRRSPVSAARCSRSISSISIRHS